MGHFGGFDMFYESLRWSNPGMGALMNEDLRKVTISALRNRHEDGYPAVVRLRQRCLSLPTPMLKIMDHVLVVELGYSLRRAAEVEQIEIALNTVRRSRQIHGV